MAVTRFSFSTEQVLRIIHELDGIAVPARTLGYWATIGLVVPSVAWARRRGRHQNARLYSAADVARARLVVRLRAAGMGLRTVRIALAYVAQQLPELLRPGTRARLQVDRFGNATVLGTPHGDVTVPDGQLVLLPLNEVVISAKAAAWFSAA